MVVPVPLPWLCVVYVRAYTFSGMLLFHPLPRRPTRWVRFTAGVFFFTAQAKFIIYGARKPAEEILCEVALGRTVFVIFKKISARAVISLIPTRLIIPTYNI